MEELLKLADCVHDEHNLAACISSGSFVTDGMIIMPCSMKTLAGIATGYADNLTVRAADVCMKAVSYTHLAARVAALIGHKVTLLERSEKLGGVMGEICTAKFKKNIKELTKWYLVQLQKLGVDVRLNTTATADDPLLETCDRIIIGCGAVPVVPPIPGIDGKNVISILDAHRDPKPVSYTHLLGHGPAWYIGIECRRNGRCRHGGIAKSIRKCVAPGTAA